MSPIALLLILAIVVMIAVVPAWPHSRRWGFAPSGIVGVLLVVVLVVYLARGGA